MQQVVLLGDSIRLAYQARVAGALAGQAAVSGPEDNCRFSAYTLFYLAQWLPADGCDAIHWNNGQWDTCYMPDGRIHTPLATYLELQERIAAIVLRKARRAIFATTTPVWPEQFASGGPHPRRNEDIQAYNAAAAERLGRLGVEIDDLYTPLAADIKRYVSADMVHLTDAGNELCADRIARLLAARGT